MEINTERFIEAVRKYKTIAIYIPGSPDPDAIASAFALKTILGKLEIEATIYAEKNLSLTQNKIFVDRLQIPVIFEKELDPHSFDAYMVPDFQDNYVELIGTAIPCAAHFDHHSKAQSSVKCDFSLINTSVGSTSTLLTLFLRESALNFSKDELNKMATALTFGIQTDTGKYSHITEPDFEALSYLAEFADPHLLGDLNSMPPSPAVLHTLKKAKQQENSYKDWAFYGAGYLQNRHRDTIAIAADILLAGSAYELVAVFALIEETNGKGLYLDVSIRAREPSLDLNQMVKQISPEGGGRQYKAAYQVDLRYFKGSPDPEKLWSLVKETTVELLKKSRDTVHTRGFQKIFGSLKDRLLALLKKSS